MNVAKARRTQLLSTYGVGSLFPSDTTSYMIAGIHEWKPRDADTISEPRLARSLGVSELKAPPAGSKRKRDVPVIRFPLTQVCPSCRRIDSIGRLSNDKEVALCSCEKGTQLSPFRLIVACARGHIDEFPYFRWLHKGQDGGSNHVMHLRAQGRTSSLADLELTCTCGVQPRTLDGSAGPKALAEFGTCAGRRPWLGPDSTQPCEETPRTLQRGASNVWLPAVRSAISIPPYSAALAKFVDRHWISLGDPEAVTPALLRNLSEHSRRFSVQQIETELERRRGEALDDLLTEEALRRQEYAALMEGREQESLDDDFVCLDRDVPVDLEHLISDVRKVTRLREVRALYGFTRLDDDNSEDNLCALSPDKTHWLPAIEVIGEGIFIAFHRDALEEWAKDEFATDRWHLLRRAAGPGLTRPGERSLTGLIRVAIHTFAHVVIDQLSLAAGYPAASLRERLYVDDGEMAGVLIYTASSDSAGSLGGVASQAEPERLGPALAEGLARLSWCSADPVCIESQGSGTDALNLAACHACVLLPETSCELGNRYLDRALLFGTPEGGRGGEGLFSDVLTSI
ncbi:hypothetical protein CH281_12135 [Rhodococcus sp. 06-221-2]|uniref:DrmB family protein n=1 Tax=Rhodococcus sp. 06-221-2 TaxID=2022514 RepID=UPI000B9A1D74|nr:DrmB family protein [Rhodococcus sp. 06-221-2]OZD03560.1 hypothetical protein CH281_12135 [Rhodococcus sp. 06-221-2]